MATAAPKQRANSTSKRVVGRPFPKGVSGNPKGRKPKPPEQTKAERELARLAQLASERVVADVMGELRSMTGPAIDRLRRLLDSKDEAIALRAACDVLSRVNGLPVATNIVHAELNNGGEVRRLSAEDVANAAKLYLLRQGAALAAEAQERAE